jgi:hypothetical protein
MQIPAFASMAAVTRIERLLLQKQYSDPFLRALPTGFIAFESIAEGREYEKQKSKMKTGGPEPKPPALKLAKFGIHVS